LIFDFVKDLEDEVQSDNGDAHYYYGNSRNCHYLRWENNNDNVQIKRHYTSSIDVY
jgi:hypothetical protein